MSEANDRKPAARPYIGGQAVLEGVMMRSPKSVAIVVRRKDRSLHVYERPVSPNSNKFARLPLVRGVASLVESIKLGMEALQFSADQMEKDLLAADANTAMLSAIALFHSVLSAAASGGDGPASASPQSKSGEGGVGGKAMGVLTLVLVLGVFIALPQMAAAFMSKGLGLGLAVQSPGFQALTGLFKLVIVVSYMSFIRHVPEMRRTFEYHGAEHKTISTYEANEELTVENARKKTTLHPRCGTTFLVMVALVSILVFTAVGGLLPRIDTGNAVATNAIFFLEKLPFLPFIAAITFEIQRVFARYCTTGPLRLLLWPGFLVQKITTIEPDDGQLEVALGALRATLFREEQGDAAISVKDARFADYDTLAAAPSLAVVT